MFVVMRYTGPQKIGFILIGTFPDRFDAEQYALNNCQMYGWAILPLLPADSKVS